MTRWLTDVYDVSKEWSDFFEPKDSNKKRSTASVKRKHDIDSTDASRHDRKLADTSRHDSSTSADKYRKKSSHSNRHDDHTSDDKSCENVEVEIDLTEIRTLTITRKIFQDQILIGRKRNVDVDRSMSTVTRNGLTSLHYMGRLLNVWTLFIQTNLNTARLFMT